MKIALTGANGFIASNIIKKFPNYITINRNDSEKDILKKLENVDVVFNLAGATILKRWNENYKKTLVSSRIQTTKKLVNAINKSSIKHFISTSAIGIYPDNTPCDESCTNLADNFLGNLAKKWEEEALKSNKPTAIFRLGVVLGNGGALKEILLPFKFGFGGIIGNGEMKMSWIDIDDLIRMYQFIIKNHLTGIFNATAPYSVTNTEFTKTLAKTLNRPAIFKIPEFLLYLKYSEGAKVLTSSKEIYPKRILKEGFEFKYPTIKKSLNHLLCKNN
ncbi:conserved hypothetical protein [Lebetimonas natsushimae]|uniref:TIGR01777 family protein n=1 Tax=Lebetimonas natsushimae TaxID=1936991 RepID=A0A292YC11_9BACT|nr:TIGR01777 family oxidoreductase [Lebetimonas natsushimae]GAX87617.1 conserved hypothetical protein [Lebetimonas natsushimae]